MFLKIDDFIFRDAKEDAAQNFFRWIKDVEKENGSLKSALAKKDEEIESLLNKLTRAVSERDMAIDREKKKDEEIKVLREALKQAIEKGFAVYEKEQFKWKEKP